MTYVEILATFYVFLMIIHTILSILLYINNKKYTEYIRSLNND